MAKKALQGGKIITEVGSKGGMVVHDGPGREWVVAGMVVNILRREGIHIYVKKT